MINTLSMLLINFQSINQLINSVFELKLYALKFSNNNLFFNCFKIQILQIHINFSHSLFIKVGDPLD